MMCRKSQTVQENHLLFTYNLTSPWKPNQYSCLHHYGKNFLKKYKHNIFLGIYT